MEAARDGLAPATARVLDVVPRILAASHEAELRLDSAGSAPAAALADMRGQLTALVYPGFISGTGLRRLPDLVRYLQAIVRRLDKMGESLARDAERMATVHRVTGEYREFLRLLPPPDRVTAAVTEVRWMIEELRVSLFAQTLGTPMPVSEKRIYAVLDRLAARLG